MKQRIIKIFQKQKKEENDEYPRKLVRNLNNKEKYSPYDRDDFDYYGIRDIENLFDKVSEEDYSKPILVKILLRVITNIMKAEEIKKKDYQ